MSQNWYNDVYQASTKSANDIMGQIELMLETLKSGFAGAAYAADPVSGMACHRPMGRRVRNYANTGWLASLMGDANQRMWVYRNDTCEGWLVDATVTDVGLAIRGGSQAYNVNGGNLAGSWTVSGLSYSHIHRWNIARDTNQNDGTYNSSGNAIYYESAAYKDNKSGISLGNMSPNITPIYPPVPPPDLYTSFPTLGAVASSATWRPRAAVGTLQYPDLT